MIRLLGACMIVSGCTGLGLWYRAQFFGHIRALRILENILELLAGEVRYGRATLPECCGHIEGYLESPFREAFRKIHVRMGKNEGLSFGEVFREEIISGLETLPLQADDREEFLRFALQTGFADGQMQLRTLEHSVEILKGKRTKLEKENAEKCRMAVGLGAMSGLLILLVLW